MKLSLSAYIQQHCPLLCHLIFRGAATPHLTRLPEFLVEVLYLESSDFVTDLEDTDVAINNASSVAAVAAVIEVTGVDSVVGNQAARAVSPGANSKNSVSPPSKNFVKKGVSQSPQIPGSTQRRKAALPIPVAEMVVAAHASLLLHIILQTSRTDSSQKLITVSGAEPPQPLDSLSNQRAVLSLLPRGNWWLCERVLKAFLSLQGQVHKK